MEVKKVKNGKVGGDVCGGSEYGRQKDERGMIVDDIKINAKIMQTHNRTLPD